MATGAPVPIKFPRSSFPGASTQESAGRLINCYADPLGEPGNPTGPTTSVLRRSPGLSQHNNGPTGQVGYRGGLVVGNLSYETWSGNASTVDASGNYTSLGAFPGTKRVSIARNLNGTPDVIGCDIDNGAYQLSTGGAPVVLNTSGAVPQANSVSFQDGYFFLTIADGRVFASPINNIVPANWNALTFVKLQSKADVVLLRGIAYGGLMFFFTTGGCEVWQDTAQPAPAFPYTRLTTMPFGLVQANAIAGWETGFDNLIWAAQDFAIYNLPWGQVVPTKISTPDVDRFIEAQNKAGALLDTGIYEFAGKKIWTISSNLATTTWEFNLVTQEWNERASLVTAQGTQNQWRGTGGHPAFGRWLMGDRLSGNLLYPDSANFTENGSPQLVRIESGPVEEFPIFLRVARADFEFVTGTGIAAANVLMTVLGTAAGTGGVVRLQVNNTAQVSSGDTLIVANVGGTTEANGTFLCNVIDGFHVDLIGTVFVHAWTSGGTATDITSPTNAISPSVAVSMSKDGGITWGNPLIRSLGQQARSKRVRISVKSMGLSGPMGVRWRLDVSDPVYCCFLKAAQQTDPREHSAGA